MKNVAIVSHDSWAQPEPGYFPAGAILRERWVQQHSTGAYCVVWIPLEEYSDKLHFTQLPKNWEFIKGRERSTYDA